MAARTSSSVRTRVVGGAMWLDPCRLTVKVRVKVEVRVKVKVKVKVKM